VTPEDARKHNDAPRNAEDARCDHFNSLRILRVDGRGA